MRVLPLHMKPMRKMGLAMGAANVPEGRSAHDAHLRSMAMRIAEVSDARTLNDWMRLPWRIYASDPNWIPT